MDINSAPRGQTQLFECTEPGCSKKFRRKEHLTRHAKTHASSLEYACHICGRRYARSDVLKRHVDAHPQYSNTNRGFVACEQCHDSKTKCDESTPCTSCSRRSLRCSRVAELEGADVLPSASANRPGLTSLEEVQAQTSLVSNVTPSQNDPHGPNQSFENVSLATSHLELFLRDIYPFWPIIQPADVALETRHSLWTSSINTIVRWYHGDSQWTSSSLREQLCNIQFDPRPPLLLLQALLLCAVRVIYCLSGEGTLPEAIAIRDVLVTTSRRTGILAAQLSASPIDALYNALAQDLTSRLAIAVLQIDTYVSTLAAVPPMIRHLELLITMPRPADLPNQSVLDGNNEREKRPLCLLVQDHIDPVRRDYLAYRLLPRDYEAILCAMQSGIWEASWGAHVAGLDRMGVTPTSNDLIESWRKRLQFVYESMETDCKAS
ncbi:hypothetical protein F5Y15DRAFT_150521 [Xylariaceae sp. FL0016]|nr:hypothetical protein F5Y15DRAFT_150521 [Xylariaceae sp. FL0016]